MMKPSKYLKRNYLNKFTVPEKKIIAQLIKTGYDQELYGHKIDFTVTRLKTFQDFII
jgi:hypothetical protein